MSNYSLKEIYALHKHYKERLSQECAPDEMEFVDAVEVIQQLCEELEKWKFNMGQNTYMHNGETGETWDHSK